MRDGLVLDDLTWAGARLLDGRLRSARVANWVTYSLGLVGLFFLSNSLLPDRPSESTVGSSLRWLSAGVVMMCVAVSARAVLLSRGRRRLAVEVGRRVASDHGQGVVQRLGRVRVISGIAVLVVSVAVVFSAAGAGSSGGVVAVDTALVILTAAVALILGRHEALRATLAVDAATLRVDERWRSQAVAFAVLPMVDFLANRDMVLLFSTQSVPAWVSVIGWAGLAVLLGAVLLELTAQSADQRAMQHVTT
ncbi:MAG: hypothetical protein INR66_25180 [Gordonia polyisoprenivorans]|nr:hypothetical protein [Gordonia polyisoprenivorans]